MIIITNKITINRFYKLVNINIYKYIYIEIYGHFPH